MKVTENGVFNLRVFSFRVFYVKKNENMVFNRLVATIIKELDMSNGEQCRLAHRNLLINTTEIAQMANVSVSTVSNWKRRSNTFPEPVGTKDGKPAFDYDQVSRWLRDNNKEFHDNRMRSLVWEYANRVRGKMDAVEGSARFVALLHLLLPHMYAHNVLLHLHPHNSGLHLGLHYNNYFPYILLVYASN